MGVWAGKACYARYGEQGCKKWVYGREKTWFAQFVEQRWNNGCIGRRIPGLQGSWNKERKNGCVGGGAFHTRYRAQGWSKWVCGRGKTSFAQFVEQR